MAKEVNDIQDMKDGNHLLKCREELIQVAAVALAWVEGIDKSVGR